MTDFASSKHKTIADDLVGNCMQWHLDGITATHEPHIEFKMPIKQGLVQKRERMSVPPPTPLKKRVDVVDEIGDDLRDEEVLTNDVLVRNQLCESRVISKFPFKSVVSPEYLSTKTALSVLGYLCENVRITTSLKTIADDCSWNCDLFSAVKQPIVGQYWNEMGDLLNVLLSMLNPTTRVHTKRLFKDTVSLAKTLPLCLLPAKMSLMTPSTVQAITLFQKKLQSDHDNLIEFLNTLISERDDTEDTPSIDENVVSKSAEIEREKDDSERRLIEYRPVFEGCLISILNRLAESGTVQACAMMCLFLQSVAKCVASESQETTASSLISSPEIRTQLDRITDVSTVAYVELLKRFQLHSEALVLLVHMDCIPICSKGNNPAVYEAVNTVYNVGRYAPKIPASHVICCICQLPVCGISIACPVCGHGGHPDHIRDWYARNSCCPSGCGHICNHTL